MDENRKKAYLFLLCAALMHLKWDLVGFWQGLSLWRPWRLVRDSHFVRRAACRAIAFHNLAFFLSCELAGFSEEMFWNDIEEFSNKFPRDFADYRDVFDRKIAGEPTSVTTLPFSVGQAPGPVANRG